MLLRIPDFYDSFHCLGGKCPDNCCIGSELEIDDDTFAYYQSVEGPFGDRLRANMADAVGSPEDNTHSFHLQVGGRCPFLNGDNLCDICLELGPDALCSICTEYPRHTFEWGGVIEKSLTLSCPEAGRLLFLNDIPVTFKEIPMDANGLAAYMDDEIYGEMGHDDKRESDPYTEPDDEWVDINPRQLREIRQIRSKCLQILQDRTLPIENRVTRYLQMSKYKQLALADADSPSSKKPHLQKSKSILLPPPAEIDSSPLRDDFSGFKKRLEILAGMEILSSRWASITDSLERKLGPAECTYRRILNSYITSDDYRKYAYTYEHLLVYFTFRYFPLAVYDSDVRGKSRFSVFCTLVIRDMDALRYCERGAFTFADRIENAGDFSKQVEQTDYNIWHLMEELS